MFWTVVLVVLIVAAVFAPKKIMDFNTTKVKIGVLAVLMLLLGLTFAKHVKPGEVVRVYQVSGGERTLTVGLNFCPPWDRTQTWDATTRSYVFAELGDEADPNDAFGGQTANGDYMTTVANLSVRIDTGRMADYIAMFGTRNLGDEVGVILKGVLKDSFERCLEKRPSEEVMSHKSEIVNEARGIAIKRIEEQLPLIVAELTYPDIAASDAYEMAIKAIADARMQEQLFVAEKTKNEKKAEADKATADGNAVVAKTNADADRYKRETAAAADATAVKMKAQADADALLLRAAAEEEASKKLGTLYAQYPALLDVKLIEIYGEIGKSWDGHYIPSIGGGNGVNILDIAGILDRVLQQQPSASAPSVVPED